ncbi:MAG TPA: GGDEF domain-containing protein, partial [Ilumatobacter sp.]|nr:GGDEF domain-containing protein [Ilumatobacter sp.]
RRASVTPVHLHGELVAAYLLFGRVAADYQVDVVNTNVMTRIRALVDVTSLLFERWSDSDRLAQAALRDTLTGLANRLAFNAAIEDVAAESVVLFIDVDHFKAVNDDLGHDAGDQMLVEVAHRLLASCRPTDTVARLGGDEFVVLLPDTDAANASLIARRIIRTVEQPMTIAGAERVVTVSLGLAATGVGNVGDAMLHADRAMLHAKREGRGRMAVGKDARLA